MPGTNRRFAILAVVGGCSLVGPRLTAQIVYDVSFPNAVHHEAEISVTFADIPAGPLEVRMSRSSPGRYALHEFAKNVYAVRAFDGAGRALRITRPNPYQWDVSGHDGTVTVRYTLFADRAGGTYSQFDDTHAHMNMPATFMWARGLDDRAMRITFHPPDGSDWKVATQLAPTSDPFTFTAPSLQYFMDSPTELSDFSMRTWQVSSGGRDLTIRLAVHHLGTEPEVDAFAEMARRIVSAEMAVFGELPAYDYGTYTFIADYLPWASGDGMEHRNSTILASTGSLGRSALGLLGTVSHEFFHAWNVERIRPRALEPFDFERANMSAELWFAEGFTSYYTPLFIRRAGLISVAEYASRLSGGLSVVVNSPARAFFSPMEMSMQAPFVDAATAVDPVNTTNTFISYYTWGSVIGLHLDLALRASFDRTLDDYMRLVWREHGKTEIPYTVDDLEEALGRLTGDAAFAGEFFGRYVRGSDLPDYAALLAPAGLLFRPRAPDAAFLGLVQLEYDADGALVASGTQIGSPLYDAGIDRNDRILTLDGRPLLSDEVWADVNAAHGPGDTIPVEFESRGRHHQGTIVLVADPRLEVVTFEDAGRSVGPDILAFRERWLGAEQ